MGSSNAIDVLLVEDDESHARLIQRAFKESGVLAEIRWANDLRSMNAELNSKRPDVLILDYLLPDGRGLDYLSTDIQLRDLPTIIITSFSDSGLASEAKSIGVINVVQKSQAGFNTLPHLVGAEFAGKANFSAAAQYQAKA